MLTRRALPRTLFSALAVPLIIFAPVASASQRQPRLIESVEVRGNRRLAADEILRHLQVRVGDPYDDAQAQRDLETLANLRLFDMRETRLVVQLGQRGGVEIAFEVKELPLIAEMRFEGPKGLDESEVLDAFRKNKIKIAKGDVYQPDETLNATRIIKDLLSARGQSGLTVEARTAPITKTSVKLTFVVTEQDY